jgi:protein TonB
MSTRTLSLPLQRPNPLPGSRHGRVVAAVVLVHLALIWVAEQGLLQRPAPVEMAQVIMASTIVQAQAEPAVRAQPQAAEKPEVRPQPVEPTPTPAVQAESAGATALPVTANKQPGDATTATTTQANAAPVRQAGPAAAPALVLPSADADYLNNPPPAYPRQSKRMGEQGTVVLRVLIGLQGTAEKAEVRSSSGFARLDQAALETVQRWRYAPGRRNGSPEAMWFNVPVRFILE